MQIKSGFMLREVAGSWIVVPLGQRVVEFNGLMTLSESGALIWKMLDAGAETEELISIITSEYDIDEDTAREDIHELIAALEQKGLIE
ncbi:MAG: PqqD family protein [Clostridia bacterium]|nr:PqqD family protein [Clostridia bacterium]